MNERIVSDERMRTIMLTCHEAGMAGRVRFTVEGADGPEIVRCRSCVHAVLGFADGGGSRTVIGCDRFDRPYLRNVIEVEPDGFCALGRHVTPAAQ